MLAVALFACEPRREDRGPRVVRVRRRSRSVGDRVAERDDERRPRRRVDVDAGEPVVRHARGGVRNRRARREVARSGDVGRTEAGRVRGRRAGVAREVEADGQIGQRRHGELDGIADHDDAWRQLDGGAAGKGQRAIGRRDDSRLLVAERDVRGADLDRRTVERVRELHAETLAADARAERHPDRLIVQRLERGWGSRWRDDRRLYGWLRC